MAAPLVGCGVDALDTGPEAIAPSSIKRVTVPPRVSSPIWFDTAANARCELSAGGAQPITLSADDEGRAVVFVNPNSASATPEALVLTCDGTAQTIELSIVEGAAAPAYPVRSRHATRTLAGLSADVAESYTDAGLRAMGYPPRPPADASRDAHAKWLEAVSRPYEVLEPIRVEGRRRASTATNTWSGAVLFGASARAVNYVYGAWTVPAIGTSATDSEMVQWVGVDGYNNTDLWQTGTDAVVRAAQFGNIAVYNVWTETLPTQGTIAFNYPSAGVRPGDSVSFAAYISPRFPSYAVDYSFWDHTQNTSFHVSETFNASQNPWVGRTVEWIVENPLYPFGGSDLANFGSTSMTGWGGYDNGYAGGTIEDWYAPGGSCLFAGACESAFPSLSNVLVKGVNSNTGRTLDHASLSSGGQGVNVFWDNYN